MDLREAIEKSQHELDSARIEGDDTKIREIFAALDASPVADALARSLYLSLAEVVTRRPEMVNAIARQYLGIGIWMGRRVKDLMDGKPPQHNGPA